jgi:hypothetical protein
MLVTSAVALFRNIRKREVAYVGLRVFINIVLRSDYDSNPRPQSKS